MSTVPAPALRDRVYEILAGDDVDRVCLDIPEESCREQPRNFLLHVSVLATALATISSSYVWGRLSDVSSRRVLVVAAAIGATCLGVAAAIGAGFARPLGIDADSVIVLPSLVFGATIADQGVKLGRTTHVVDMSDASSRGAYTALTNTIGGIATLAAGVFGLIDQYFGAAAVLVTLALMCVLAMKLASGLEDVQRDDRRSSASSAWRSQSTDR